MEARMGVADGAMEEEEVDLEVVGLEGLTVVAEAHQEAEEV